MSNQWQYKVFVIKSEFLGLKTEKIGEALNKLGAQGWELVCNERLGTEMILYLKKPG
jgi:hypothetical protein